MSVESDVVAALLAHAPLAALIGDRFAPDKVRQGEARPYVVYVVEREPVYALEVLMTTRYVFKCQVWADTRDEAEIAADALEAAMQAATIDGTSIPTDSRETINEHDLDLEGVEVAFHVWDD